VISKATSSKTRQTFLVILISIGALAADGAFGSPPGMPFGWNAPAWGHNAPPQRNWKPHMKVKYGSYPPVVYYQDGNTGIYWKYNDARGIWDGYCTDYNEQGKWRGFLCTQARGADRLSTVLWMDRGAFDSQDSDCYRLNGRVFDANNKATGEGFAIWMWGCF